MRAPDIGIGAGAFAEIFPNQGAMITGVGLSARMFEKRDSAIWSGAVCRLVSHRLDVAALFFVLFVPKRSGTRRDCRQRSHDVGCACCAVFG